MPIAARIDAVMLFLILMTPKAGAQTGAVDGTWRLDALRSDAPLMGRRGNQVALHVSRFVYERVK